MEEAPKDRDLLSAVFVGQPERQPLNHGGSCAKAPQLIITSVGLCNEEFKTYRRGVDMNLCLEDRCLRIDEGGKRKIVCRYCARALRLIVIRLPCFSQIKSRAPPAKRRTLQI